MLTITDIWSTPPGGYWTIKNPEDGVVLRGAIPNELWRLWMAHRRENDQSALSFAEMQDTFCRQLPADCPTCGAAAVNPYAYPDIAEWRKVETMPITVWGPAGWACLHRHQIVDDPHENERWLLAFRESIPCNQGPRFCRQHFAEYMATYPADFSSQDAWFIWTWQAHNETNQRTGKPQMPLEDARAMYANQMPVQVEAPPA